LLITLDEFISDEDVNSLPIHEKHQLNQYMDKLHKISKHMHHDNAFDGIGSGINEYVFWVPFQLI